MMNRGRNTLRLKTYIITAQTPSVIPRIEGITEWKYTPDQRIIYSADDMSMVFGIYLHALIVTYTLTWLETIRKLSA